MHEASYCVQVDNHNWARHARRCPRFAAVLWTLTWDTLETEAGLQFELAVRRLARKWSPRDRDGLSEKRRGQRTDRRCQIHAVENVARVHAERQVVAAIGTTRAKDRAHASGASTVASATAAGSSAMIMTTAPRRPPLTLHVALPAGLAAEAERLAEPDVQSELCWSRKVIHRNARIVRTGRGVIKASVQRLRARAGE